jgi:hypothetical protein
MAFAAVAGGSFCAAAADSKKVEIPIRAVDLKEAAKVSYTRDIKPLLSADCDECHSNDDFKGGFDISSAATLMKGGKKGGPGIVPGKPDESSIVKYIRGLADGPQMPKGETPLSENELHLIRSWIAAGAVDDSGRTAALAGTDAVRTNTVSSLAADAARHWEDVLIFSNNKDEQFAARRALRLGLVAPAAPPPKVAGPAFNEIDPFVEARWAEAKLPEAQHPPAVCDDATFVRRVYLDVIGVIPSAQASREFVADKAPGKRTKLVDALLARQKDYAAHWTPFWEEALASQPSMGGVGTHGDYSDFIYKSFAENKPYDLMVAEILDPTMPGYQKADLANANGKINVIGFVRNQTHTDTMQTAANTAQIFLGTGMKCASCHNHFLNKEWPQARFTAFAGLFATNDLELIRCEKHSGHFVAAAFPFDLPDAPKKVPQDPQERLHYAATLLIDPTNPRFAKTIVNRLWKRYLGLGLFEPADDFRLDRAPSNPPLLDWLADDFMRHNYDLKHTIRLILTSRAYQLRYDPALEDHFDAQKPDQPRYARSPSLRRLTAEQFMDSIHEAAAPHWDGQRLFRSVASTAFTRAMGRPPVRNEVCTGRAADVAVVQSLELLNGTELHDLAYNGEVLDELASLTDRKRIVEELYWSVLSRTPTSRESKLGLAYLEANAPGSAAAKPAGPQDTVWFQDKLPAGANPNGMSWRWVQEPLFGGAKSHTLDTTANEEQHYFLGAQPLNFHAEDRLFSFVYIDPAHPPEEIMLQWNQNGWDHRAFWGADKIEFGRVNEPSRQPMGSLPKAGQWVRLEVPVSKLGLNAVEGIDGMSFDQAGGKVYWGSSGVAHQARPPETAPLGDMLWALAVSPEFQYIR